MLRAIVFAGFSLPLAGCAQQWMESAQNECVAFGFVKDTPEYAECVQRQYQDNRSDFGARLGRAAAITNSGQTAAGPARTARFLRRSYVSGMNRICVYDSMGSQEVITIGAGEMCPIN